MTATKARRVAAKQPPRPKPRKTRPQLLPVDLNQRYSPEEAALYLRTSRVAVFADLREGRLESIREGKRRFIPGTEIARRSRLSTVASGQAVRMDDRHERAAS